MQVLSGNNAAIWMNLPPSERGGHTVFVVLCIESTDYEMVRYDQTTQ